MLLIEKKEEIFMKRAIQLAKNGLGIVSPNPMVGCVIVKNGLVISEAWNRKNHAEKIAINQIKNKNIFVDSTLYVTLEPCVHFRKTTHCVIDLIIKKKIPRVVIGMKNPNKKLNGIGIKKLVKNGVKVIENFLSDQCLILNKRFFTFHEKKRPYVILKWVQSNDGFIMYSSNNKCGIISSQLNHKWRSEEDSILIKKKTVFNENTKLNVRKWYGKNPIKIFIDKKLNIPNFYIENGNQESIIFTEKKNILNHLYKKCIQSLIVEGDRNTLENFIKKDIWDECRIFVSNNIILKNGIEAPKIKGKTLKCLNIDQNMLFFKIRI
ncbi:bifunctional diaminohydroxyphosphoribosylaminopyrimidine deaminase/5-amino-6-(5-phosphoribosylamino)uracil reductase RibD [Blattabacterium cuenoti]|uniref:bifunctional diaminohydroxyphosphoribosylaminopyrimidine deaminase/5-amino-6-(5-phosphoribosylamino)uracil reductase RibD n=1 Tax=Blattabacterium cuenoti TaxID=1653831 RepID=UPI00163C93BC|nr:bifunctional diaminohydroxyphosphoribosylaminopyrimidine deaminase/5-amino-6-(5-phosphoribosylamino)uracil reductase RibD [Blattabacterium cuenoti]